MASDEPGARWDATYPARLAAAMEGTYGDDDAIFAWAASVREFGDEMAKLATERDEARKQLADALTALRRIADAPTIGLSPDLRAVAADAIAASREQVEG